MRIGTLILGLLGGLFSALLGLKWLSDASEYAEELELAKQLGIDTGSIVTAAYLLLVTAVAGVAGGVMATKGKGKVASAVMIGAGVLPVIFEGKAAIATIFVVIGGLLALRADKR